LPLVNGEWRDTTPEDIEAFEKSLRGDTAVEVPLTEELESRLASLDRSGPSMAVLVEGNRRLYPQLERVLDKRRAVKIVVPVYNAWHIARRCLEAVRTRTSWTYELVVVDDASDDYTRRNLVQWMDQHGGVRQHGPVELLRNEKNRGFAATVNRGIRGSQFDVATYVCLLNSDVLVTPGWLTKMVLALESDERNAIVCPATNNTAVVDIPMSQGASYLHMNQALEAFAQRRYPEILPTGFCFMFRRSLLDEIGYFDEGFRDFGEETDFWWKAVKAGYRAVMADDTYVFHERASSYSSLGAEKHGGYRRAASARFNQLHPEWTEWRDANDVKKALGPLRQPVPPTLLRSPRDLYRICWLVHDARACGAMRYIADIVNELCERGVNAKVAVLRRENVPMEWLGELRSAPVFFDSPEELVETFAHRVFPDGLAVAGTVELSPAVRALVDASRGTIRGCLHAQSFDVDLAQDEASKTHLRGLYQLLPDVISSSQWVGREIAAIGPTPFAVVHPGVDRTLFYPRDRSKGDERPTVMIPMNPSVWWRGWDRGLELIAELDKQATERGIDLRILVYGVDSLPITSRAICLGVVTQSRLATLLGTEVDAFVDPSYVHSYGMPCLEASASGVATFSWDNRGIEETGLAEPFDGDPASMAISVLHVVGKFGPIQSLIDNHDREKGIEKWIAAVEYHFKLLRKHRRICMVVPHLRKWGGPTTMLFIAHELAKRGHKVEVVSVYEDIHPSIAALAEVPISKGPELPEADLYITNSDNPWVERISAVPAKRILLKLSHNPRFKREEELGLRQGWDAIVCSTQWLVDACHQPMEGWDHPAVDARAIGWWHYEHARFRRPPMERTYGDGTAENPFVIGTLVHGHPTKGMRDAFDAFDKLRELMPTRHFRFFGVGEVPARAVQIEGWEYVHEPSRDRMAALMQSLDVWVSASHSEGLGRMTLEAMSAGCAVVARDNGSSHLVNGETTWLALHSSEIAVCIAEVLSKPGFASHLRKQGFETAERAADPKPCIDALESVIEAIYE
jgi:O-antigen biosynthesis protein